MSKACRLFQCGQANQTNAYSIRADRVVPVMDYENLFCRVCFSGVDPEMREGGQLISPCSCTGSVRCIHLHCLRTWQATQKAQGRSLQSQSCELCGSKYTIPQKVLQQERRQLSFSEKVQMGLKEVWQWCNDTAQGPIWQEAMRYWRNGLLVRFLVSPPSQLDLFMACLKTSNDLLYRLLVCTRQRYGESWA